jgi:hypothetical protein
VGYFNEMNKMNATDQTPTPRTDAAEFTIVAYPHPTEPFGEVTIQQEDGKGLVNSSFARQLERELAQAQQREASLRSWLNQIYNIAVSTDGGPLIMEGRRSMIVDIARREQALSTQSPGETMVPASKLAEICSILEGGICACELFSIGNRPCPHCKALIMLRQYAPKKGQP